MLQQCLISYMRPGWSLSSGIFHCPVLTASATVLRRRVFVNLSSAALSVDCGAKLLRAITTAADLDTADLHPLQE
jgi:energy-converting hydrogenase Eha subunit A